MTNVRVYEMNEIVYNVWVRESECETCEVLSVMWWRGLGGGVVVVAVSIVCLKLPW